MSTVEFQSRVLEYFHKKQAEGKLDFAFPKPTPAKIKTACLEILETRFEKRDERFLYSYFKPGNGQDLHFAVNKFDRDKFKPLNSYLQDHSKNPRFEQIQLLAWLIDFPDRPYQTSYERSIKSNDPIIESKDLLLQDTESEGRSNSSDPLELQSTDLRQEHINKESTPCEGTMSDKEPEAIMNGTVNDQKKIFWINRTVYAIAFGIFFTLGIAFWLGVNDTPKRRNLIPIPIIGQSGCVIWDEDHYKNVSCNPQAKRFASIGLDAKTVRELRKITLPDTITTGSLKHIWYVKINDQLEYYTSAGFHPIHTELRLRPLTTYIYNKYLFHYNDKTKEQLSLF